MADAAQIDAILRYNNDVSSLNTALQGFERAFSASAARVAANLKTQISGAVSGAVSGVNQSGGVRTSSVSSSAAVNRSVQTTQQQGAYIDENGNISVSPTGNRNVNAAANANQSARGRGPGLLGGFGMYMAGGMIGGPAGMLGAGLMMKGGGLGYTLGAPLLAGGAIYKAGRGAISGASSLADLLGIGPSGLQAYADFERALFVSSANLGEAFGDKGVKLLGDKAKELAVKFGMAGDAMDFAVLMRRITGSGLVTGGTTAEKVTQTADIAKVAAGLSMVSEGATPEEAGLALLKIRGALKAVGKDEYSNEQIAAMINRATRSGLFEMGDITAQSGVFASAISMGRTPEEALGLFSLMGNIGLTRGEAGTTIKRMMESAGKLSVASDIGSLIGKNPGDVASMKISDIVSNLLGVYGKSGFGGEQMSFFMQQLFPELRSSRGYQKLATALTNNPGNFQSFMANINGSPVSVSEFNKLVSEAGATPANRFASLQNMLGNFKLTAGGYVAPLYTNVAERFLMGKKINPATGEMQAFDTERNTFVQGLDSVFEQMKADAKANGDEMFIPLIEGSKKVADWFNKFTEEGKLKEIINTVGIVFSNLVSVSTLFMDALFGLAEFITKFFDIGDNSPMSKKFNAIDVLSSQLGGKGAASSFINENPGVIEDIYAITGGSSNLNRWSSTLNVPGTVTSAQKSLSSAVAKWMKDHPSLSTPTSADYQTPSERLAWEVNSLGGNAAGMTEEKMYNTIQAALPGAFNYLEKSLGTGEMYGSSPDEIKHQSDILEKQLAELQKANASDKTIQFVQAIIAAMRPEQNLLTSSATGATP